MSIISDVHLMICIAALVYIYQKARTATESRALGMVLAGFVVFFIFFQHVWIAFGFFFLMFGYLFLGGFTSGLIEGRMSGAWMHYLRNPPASAFTLGTPYTGTLSIVSIPYSSYKYLWPIPLIETNANPVLAAEQNPGW